MCVMDKCCGIDLRTGSLIIGYMNLLFNTANIILLSVSWNNEAKLKPKNRNEDLERLFTIIIIIVSLVLFILNLLFSIILLIGTHKKIRGCIKAYLILTSMIIAIFVLEVFLSLKYAMAFYLIIIRIAYLIFLCVSASVTRSYMLKGDFGNDLASCQNA